MNTRDYFFIVGCPRSGTTLLSVLLDRHSRLCVTPETAFYDEIAPRLRDCSRDSLRNLLRDWRRLPELQLSADEVLERIKDQPLNATSVLGAILDLYAQRNHKARCGEKTPQHLVHVPVILQQFPNAKILCILRDGRDVVLSLNAMSWWSKWRIPAGAPWWMQRKLLRAVDTWKQSVRLMQQFSAQYPHSFTVVRYEDLISRPAQTLSPVMEFLRETFEPQQLDAEVPSKVVLPRSIEWKGSALGNIDSDRGVRRRTQVSAKHLAMIERALRDELLATGYASHSHLSHYSAERHSS